MTIELSEMPTWPAGLSFEQAVAYSGLSASAIRKGMRDRDLTFKPLGYNGKMIVMREQVDSYLRRLFGGPLDLLEDMDFGDD